jgi:hypothetical protein
MRKVDGGERKPARDSHISVVFYFTEIVAFPGQPLELDEEGGKMA